MWKLAFGASMEFTDGFCFVRTRCAMRPGKIIKWYGTNIEIEDRKRAEEELRRNEEFLSKAQRLTQSGSFSWYLDTDEIVFSEEGIRHFRV